MRIAHVSDLHVVSPTSVHWRSVVFDKRITGYANMLLHRARVLRREYLEVVLDEAAQNADHVIVTGDITNLSLESEYDEASALLDRVAARVEVTVVPGNHDLYVPRVRREGRFAHHFHRFMKSDLPDLAVDVAAGRFPFVKLRGPTAIIGLSSAIPRPPFVSAGWLGETQLQALERVLAHPDVRARMPVILVHHDPSDSRFRLEQLRSGLVDAAQLRATLAPLGRGLVCFGHLHTRKHDVLGTTTGHIDCVAASGAGLDHPSPHIRAGYNLYWVSDEGQLKDSAAFVLSVDGRNLTRFDLAPTRVSP